MEFEHVCDSRLGQDVVAALRCEFGERARADARWMRLLHEAGRARAGSRERADTLDEFSEDEVAAALGWSRSMAGRQLALADDLAARLPAVLSAVADGGLELAKARVVSEWTRELDGDHARRVAEAVLAEAPAINQKQLIDRIGTAAVEIDEQWARKRQEAALARADVVGRSTPSGTAEIHARDLDPTQAWTGIARVEALACELRGLLRAHDVRRPIGWLRATVHGRLLDGDATGLDDDTMLAVLCAEIVEGSGPGEPDASPPGPGPDPGPGPVSGPPGPVPEPPDSVPEPPESVPEPPESVTEPPGPGADPALETGPPEPGTRSEPSPPAPEPPPGSSYGAAPDARGAVRRGVLEVRLRLSTALGLDDLPGELAGRGPLLAHAARTLMARSHEGEWRLVLTEDDGRLQDLFLLHTRPWPRQRPAGPPGSRRIVELQVPVSVLAALDPEEFPEWAPLLRRAQARLADPARRDPAYHPSTATRDAERRRPGAELDRWTRVRDRHCIGPLCSHAAHACDLDHTRDWVFHGPTVAANLGAACRHCHRLKHEAGWGLAQLTAGRFRWTTRAGATHPVRPRPVTRPAARRRPWSCASTVRAPAPPPADDEFLDDTPAWTPAWTSRRPSSDRR